MKRIFPLMLLAFGCLIAGCSASYTAGSEIEAASSKNTETAETNSQAEDDNIDDIKETRPLKGKYSGWICGLVPNDNSEYDSDVLVIQPETKEIKVLSTLKGVYQHQACAVSPDGNKIAYTKWIDENDTSKGVCIAVENLAENTSDTYFDENAYDPQITYLSWMPDNITLLCNVSLKDQQYYSDVISLLDTQTEKLRVLDKGKVWQGNIMLDYDKQIKLQMMNQEELNALIEQYGGEAYIPAEENGVYNYVEFGMPVLSPSQKKIMYATSFCRNMSVGKNWEEPGMLCLASGIHVVDLDSGEEKLIFGNNVEHSRIGKVIWGANDDEVIFDRYYNEYSKGVCDLVMYNINTKKEQTLVRSSAQIETQRPRFMVGENSVGVCSYGEEGDGLYYYDLSSDTIKKESIMYNEKELSLWRFCEIY